MACAVEGCATAAKRGQLMCWPHWKITPTKLQRAVNATWRSFRDDSRPYYAAREAAIAWHRDQSSPERQAAMF